jgi:hypothetical protein
MRPRQSGAFFTPVVSFMGKGEVVRNDGLLGYLRDFNTLTPPLTLEIVSGGFQSQVGAIMANHAQGTSVPALIVSRKELSLTESEIQLIRHYREFNDEFQRVMGSTFEKMLETPTVRRFQRPTLSIVSATSSLDIAKCESSKLVKKVCAWKGDSNA